MEYDEEDEYTLVGFTEADPLKLFISNESPIGAALIGAHLGDVVEAAMQRAQMYAEQSKRIDGEIAERLRLRNEVEGLVRCLPPVQERVLVSRYVERHPWRSIALRLNYDEGHVRRIETQAVDWIGEQMNA